MRLADKVAIVTGGGTGIGAASALRFAQDGAKVVVAGRRPGPLEEVVRQIEEAGGEATAVSADVVQVDDCRRIIRETVERFGALHVLFNNAAQTHLQKPVAEMPVEEWDQCIDATLRSVFLMSKFAAPEMRNSGGGSIINCGSVGGTQPWRGGAAYCSAKNGVITLSKVLAIILRWA
jgi:NAD(P)-dependent dehydrogenase (short-subunit alcohol dehydrogenase family)